MKNTGVGSELSWDEVSARRLARHHLDTRSTGTAADVVRAMCGAHAQVMSAAELSVGLRLADATRTDVRRSLASSQIVKTFGPRGTVHLLAATDLASWTGALGAIPRPRDPMPTDARLSADQTDAVVAAVAQALVDADLTMDELSAAVVERAGPWAGDLVMPAFSGVWPRWRQALHTAAHRGVLAFGPDRDRKVTYTSPRRRLPGFEPAEADAALDFVVRQYLHAYGPASPQHFARWLSAPAGWATTVFERTAGLEPVRLAGSDGLWQLARDSTDDRSGSGARATGVRLLPYFDAFVVGSHPRELLFPGRAAERALARGQAGNYPVVLIDGIVAGVWHMRRSGRRLDITVEPVGRLSKTRLSELAEQVERVGHVAEGRSVLTIGEITVGPHA